MSWNHRVIKRTIVGLSGTPDEYSEDHFSIVEAYYDKTGKLDGWTVNDIAPYGETINELRENLMQMLKALDKDVIVDSIP